MTLKPFLPAFFWGVFIFVVISMPAKAIPESGLLNIPHFDKIVHTTLYLVFAFFLCVGFYYLNNIELKSAGIIVVLFVGFSYGALTEIMQHYFFESRDGNFFDFAANAIGVLLGVLAFKTTYNTGFVKAFKFLGEKKAK